MTAKEYQQAKTLGCVLSAISSLKNVVPATIPEIIDPADFNEVMDKLDVWQEKLFDVIETTEEE